jgi:hypothetical protein
MNWKHWIIGVLLQLVATILFYIVSPLVAFFLVQWYALYYFVQYKRQSYRYKELQASYSVILECSIYNQQKTSDMLSQAS